MDKFITDLAAKLMGLQKLDIHRMFVHLYTLQGLVFTNLKLYRVTVEHYFIYVGDSVRIFYLTCERFVCI
jgi:hypothetical protein